MSCIKKCFGVKEGSATAETIDNVWEFIVENAAAYIEQQAKQQGVVAPDGLADKLYRAGVKKQLAPLRDKDVMYYAQKVNAAHD